MTSRDFCYWLQGFFEISGAANTPGPITQGQTSMIQHHLSLVFKHEIDPSIDKGKEELSKILGSIHDGGVVVRC